MCVLYLASAGCKADQNSSYTVFAPGGALQVSSQNYCCILLHSKTASEYIGLCKEDSGLYATETLGVSVYNIPSILGGRTNVMRQAHASKYMVSAWQL